MEKIYGNENLLCRLSRLRKNGRLPHSVIFYGERGCGKKLFADYYTMLLLCENPKDGRPCGECVPCRRVGEKNHPDVIYAQTSGKLAGYSVKTAREIRSDAFIKPNNNSGKKIYQFRDCRNMDTRTQNVLLKIIEEPPEYAYFIFTAESEYEFLPTVLSRCTALAVSLCKDEDSENALRQYNFEDNDIKEAVDCFHGNIGMCIQYITDVHLRSQVIIIKNAVDSIIRRDEYGLVKTLFSAGTDRAEVRKALSMLDCSMRDCAVLSRDKKARTIGSFRSGTLHLSEILTGSQAIEIHNLIEVACSALQSNISPVLAVSALSAEIMSVID